MRTPLVRSREDRKRPSDRVDQHHGHELTTAPHPRFLQLDFDLASFSCLDDLDVPTRVISLSMSLIEEVGAS